MKKVFITLALAAATVCTQAQDIFDNPDNHAYFGARISYELACPTNISINSYDKKDILNNGSGFAIGGIYNLPLWKNLYFEPGVSIYYNTYSVDKSYVSDELLDDIDRANIKGSSVRMWGFRIPLHIGYHFDFTPDISVSVFTGPEIALGLGAHSHTSVDNYTITKGEYGSNGSLNRCDIKWRFGVGATIMNRYYAAISGAPGICDMAKDKPSMHSHLFDITFGYNF